MERGLRAGSAVVLRHRFFVGALPGAMAAGDVEDVVGEPELAKSSESG